MDIVRIAHVDRHGHAGVRDGQCLEHLFLHNDPTAGLDGFGLRFLEIGQLHPEERKLGIPAAAPIGDQRAQLQSVQFRILAVGIAFALIPDRAADGVRDQRVDHPVEQIRGTILIQARVDGRRRTARQLGTGLARCLGGGLPFGFLGFEGRLCRRWIGLGDLLLPCVADRCQLVDPGLSCLRSPCLDRRPAPGRVDQANGHLQFTMQLTAKEIGGRRKPADRFGTAYDPASLAIVCRLGRCLAGGREHADHRQIGRGLLLLEILSPVDGHRHVRLTGTEPDFAHQHALDHDVVFPRHGQCMRSAGLQGSQFDLPSARVGGFHRL